MLLQVCNFCQKCELFAKFDTTKCKNYDENGSETGVRCVCVCAYCKCVCERERERGEGMA